MLNRQRSHRTTVIDTVHNMKHQLRRPHLHRTPDNLGVVGPDLSPDLFGEGSECQQICAGILEVLGDFGELVGQGVDDPIILGSNGLRVGLVVDRVQQGAHPRPR